MHEIGNFFMRLTSRKFLLTVFGLMVVTIYPEAQTAIVTLIATFVGAEGVGDAVSRYAVEKTKQNNLTVEHDRQLLAGDEDEDDVDMTQVLPGKKTIPVTEQEVTGYAPL